MKLKHFRWFIFLVSLSLFGLICVQVYWAYDSYRLQEKGLMASAGKALETAVADIKDHITCFELVSKVPIHPGDGFYLVRHQWKDGKFTEGGMDTIPMYFPKATGQFPFEHNSLMFNHPVNLEMVMKFRYLGDNEPLLPENRKFPTGLNSVNFSEKVADAITITDLYPPDPVDSIICSYFKQAGVDTTYCFGYFDPNKQQFVYHSEGADTALLYETGLIQKIPNGLYFGKPFELRVAFLNKESLLLAGISSALWLSGLMVSLLLAGFYFFIRVIMRQRKLSEIKNDFINNMTHEFKTPLSNISLALETLSEKQPFQNGSGSLLKIIGQETERLNDNIEKILQVARFEKDNFQLQFEAIDINQLVHKAVSSFEANLTARKARVSFQLKENCPLVEADETHLINVVCNLIDNSLKYSVNGVSLQLFTESDKDGVSFKIIDNGQGISREAQSRIFEKFYRENTGDMHNTKGFGLGLAYVKAIVDSHKGKVVVKSTVGTGSEFEIFIPFKR